MSADATCRTTTPPVVSDASIVSTERRLTPEVGGQHRDRCQRAGSVRDRHPQLGLVHVARWDGSGGCAEPSAPRRARRAAPRGRRPPRPVAGLAELGEQPVHRVEDRVAVLGADVGPDAGLAGGDAGHVAEPTGRQAQQRAVLLGAVSARRSHRAWPPSGAARVRRRRRARRGARASRVDDLGAEGGDDRCRTWRRRGRSVCAVGREHPRAPSNSSASAPSTPSCSEPAIGCPPTNRGSSIASARRRPSRCRRR